MKTKIQNAITEALKKIAPEIEFSSIEIERCKNPAHGDFATNVALKNAKTLNLKPHDLAELLLKELVTQAIDGIAEIAIAGAGFLNFRLEANATQLLFKNILEQADHFGHGSPKNKKILVEYVSANPNGPLHVGHGRGAAYGASLANVLKAYGYQVDQEYYVNDAGRQMDILALSVYWRYLQLYGLPDSIPQGIYQGAYVINIAAKLRDTVGDRFKYSLNEFIATFENTEDARDLWIDTTISNLKNLLGATEYEILFNTGLNEELADIRQDLAEFGVKHDYFYSEKSLFTNGKIATAIEVLAQNGETYEKDGNLWFKASKYGDEKDRVIRRSNGITTYFASDIAYHYDKYQRGYDLLIDIFGADHHGYMSRVQAVMSALKKDPQKLVFNLVQFAVLYKDGEKQQMSTRSGNFITLRELREMAGNDATRFFYVIRKPEQHLDFDIDLATSHSKENPFFYVEYAHARTCRVLEKAGNFDAFAALAHIDLLSAEQEKALIHELQRFADVIESAAIQYAPHLIINYLKELAGGWHHYYDAGFKVLHENADLQSARLLLTKSVQQVLRNGLAIIGVQALEKM